MKNKTRYNKKIVTLVILLNVAYVTAALYLTAHDHNVPDSLTNAWFAFTGVELLGLAAIKISEVVKGKKEGEEEQ